MLKSSKVNEDDMLQEVVTCNTYHEIVQITEINKDRVFKFVWKEVYIANNCLNYGILMFGRMFSVRMLSAQKSKGSNLQRSTF